MAMEFLPGGDLFTHVSRFGAVGDQRAALYAAELVCALEFLHARGVVFRCVGAVGWQKGLRLTRAAQRASNKPALMHAPTIAHFPRSPRRPPAETSSPRMSSSMLKATSASPTLACRATRPPPPLAPRRQSRAAPPWRAAAHPPRRSRSPPSPTPSAAQSSTWHRSSSCSSATTKPLTCESGWATEPGRESLCCAPTAETATPHPSTTRLTPAAGP